MHQWSVGTEWRLCSHWLTAWSKKRPLFTITPMYSDVQQDKDMIVPVAKEALVIKTVLLVS